MVHIGCSDNGKRPERVTYPHVCSHAGSGGNADAAAARGLSVVTLAPWATPRAPTRLRQRL